MAHLREDEFLPKYRYGHDSHAEILRILERKAAATSAGAASGNLHRLPVARPATAIRQRLA